MKITISGKHMHVSEAVQSRIEKKIGKFEKYFKDSTVAKVILSVNKKRHTMETTILFDGIILRAEETAGDMFSAIDKVYKKLEKQIHHHRSKLEKRLRHGAFHGELPEIQATDMGDQNVVRTKKFPIKPVDVEEAALQMNLLGHSFFVFMNAETNTINVLYRREDGQLGLLEPEY